MTDTLNLIEVAVTEGLIIELDFDEGDKRLEWAPLNIAKRVMPVITAAMAQDKAEHAEAVTNYRAALADCERLRMAAEAEIERLREALGLAADRLHWASVATPGITHKSAKELLAGWSQEARNVTDA